MTHLFFVVFLHSSVEIPYKLYFVNTCQILYRLIGHLPILIIVWQDEAKACHEFRISGIISVNIHVRTFEVNIEVKS